jgi:FK506-binding nuclear protein
MSDSFNWVVQFGKPLAISSEIDEHSMFVVQSAALADGSKNATLTLTVNDQKVVIANLSARKCTAKLNLLLTTEDDEMELSCNNGSKVIVSGTVQPRGCCDHDHENETEVSEDGASEDVAEQESTPVKCITEDTHDEGEEASVPDDEEEEDDDENIIDDEDEEEDEDEDEEDEEDEDEEDDDDEGEEEDDDEEEASLSASEKAPKDKTSMAKKVTFNPKEQGPHKSPSTSQPSPLKPAIKPAETSNPVVEQQKNPSRIGQTFSIQGGLKYTVLKEGKGPVAIYGKRVNVKYVGCLASNGKRFDKGQIRFRLGGGEVIEGWDKGVKDMRVGESRRLLIPPHLGYGKRGAPPAIPPNATLAFEVELLDLM